MTIGATDVLGIRPQQGGLAVRPPLSPKLIGDGQLIGDLRSIASNSHGKQGGSLRDARNAHSTNTIPELRAALTGDFDWFEGDIRVRGGNTAVMAHDGAQVGTGMKLDDWISVGSAGRRGLKLDFKDRSAIPFAIGALKDAKVPDQRIVFNVGVGERTPAAARVGLETLERIRTEFPGSTINIDPGNPPYDAASLARVIRMAKAVGGKVQVPLNVKFATERVVQQLRAEGLHVAIWNDPKQHSPHRMGDEIAKLRAWGVDGTIDLRRA